MNFKEISIYTLIPEIYKIINYNNSMVKSYVDSFYDGSLNLLKTPLSTTGIVKAAKGEFTTVVTDTLVVKQQYTNLYENVTTLNQDWYNAYTGSFALLRNASTWEIQAYKYIDVDKPYYKVHSDDEFVPRCKTTSQIVEFIIDASTASNCVIVLDPSRNGITISNPTPGQNVSLICVKYDASYGSSWVVLNDSGKGNISWTTV